MHGPEKDTCWFKGIRQRTARGSYAAAAQRGAPHITSTPVDLHRKAARCELNQRVAKVKQPPVCRLQLGNGELVPIERACFSLTSSPQQFAASDTWGSCWALDGGGHDLIEGCAESVCNDLDV